MRNRILALGIIATVLVVVFVVLHLSGHAMVGH